MVYAGFEVGAAHGVAIDRRVREWRQREQRIDASRQNAAIGTGEIDPLGLGNRTYTACDDRDGIVDRHQRPAERETVI